MESTSGGLTPDVPDVPDVSARLSVCPAPSCILVKPFDQKSVAGIILLEPTHGQRNTTGIVVATNYGPQSITIDEPGMPYESGIPFWIKPGDQVIFAAASGNEIVLPEPTTKNKRNVQRYILLKESSVIAVIEAAALLPDVNVEPRSFGA